MDKNKEMVTCTFCGGSGWTILGKCDICKGSGMMSRKPDEELSISEKLERSFLRGRANPVIEPPD